MMLEKWTGKFIFFLLPAALMLAAAPTVMAAGKGMLQGSHGDRSVLPKTCRACHRGMSMKITSEESVCLTCHGNTEDRRAMIDGGYLKLTGQLELANIGAELRKPYNHPVLIGSGVHRGYEVLPEEAVNAPRHSECFDCHEPHVVDKGNPFRGLRGKRVGNFDVALSEEYELCYKCHSSSANLPASSTNKHAEFNTTNPSFHPIEGEGRSTFVISLKEPYAARQSRPGDISVISCRDCHGNDDPNGPQGPHGSMNEGLLVVNYEMADGLPESETNYALCYKCHDRASILGNESFPFHALHIEGDRTAGQPGTSCFTCHDAHGSVENPYLIRFNENVVEANADGKLEFKAQGVAARHGSCLLRCHGVEHDEGANIKSY